MNDLILLIAGFGMTWYGNHMQVSRYDLSRTLISLGLILGGFVLVAIAVTRALEIR